jgi:hypothetical protein
MKRSRSFCGSAFPLMAGVVAVAAAQGCSLSRSASPSRGETPSDSIIAVGPAETVVEPSDSPQKATFIFASVDHVTDAIATATATAASDMGDIATDTVSGAASVAGGLASEAAGAATNTASGTVNAAMDAASGAKEMAAGSVSAATSVAVDVASGAKDVAAESVSLAASAGDLVVGETVAIASQGVEKAASAAGDVISAGTSLASLPGALGGVVSTIASLPSLGSWAVNALGGLAALTASYYVVARPFLRKISSGASALKPSASPDWMAQQAFAALASPYAAFQTQAPSALAMSPAMAAMTQAPMGPFPWAPSAFPLGGYPGAFGPAGPALGAMPAWPLAAPAASPAPTTISAAASTSVPAAAQESPVSLAARPATVMNLRPAATSERGVFDMAFQYRGEGLNWAAVAARLNQEGRTLWGLPWTPELLRDAATLEKRRRLGLSVHPAETWVS